MPRKLFALTSKAGTACSEVCLCDACDSTAARARLSAEAAKSHDSDPPVPDSWTDCSENDDIACVVCGYGSREFRFDRLIQQFKATGLDYQGVEEDYEGQRYVLLSKDIGCGQGNIAFTYDIEELAALIGGLLETTFAFAGWYDMDDEDPHPHGASWEVAVTHGPTEIGEASGDLEV